MKYTEIEYANGYLLAKIDNGLIPYVTWAVSKNRTGDSNKDECYWGRYHSSIACAAIDFERRAKLEGYRRYDELESDSA